jgi:3'-5' exoribonuclease
MKKFFVTDLKPGMSMFGESFVVKSYKKGTTKQNQPYIDIELVDRTGLIKGKVWSDSIENCEFIKEGDVVKVDGVIEEYRESPQFKISSMIKTEDYDPVDFQKVTEYSTEEMKETILFTIEEIKNSYLKKLLRDIFDPDTLTQFLDASAAMSVHHAYRGGLAEHTVEMLLLAKPVIERYPKMNSDILQAGILLHDLGKLCEYQTVLTTVLTTRGKLLGHIFIGAEIIKSKAPKDMPEPLLDELLHLILSHHGKKEFGSPVLPSTTEAIVLSSIDMMSANLNSSYHAINNLEEGQDFTSRMPNLGMIELYRSPYLNNLTNEDIPF